MDKHQKTVGKLSELSGEEFDKEYMDTMVKDHKKDIAMFEKALEKINDTELRSWTQKTLNVMKEHYQSAQDIQQTVQASAN